MEVKISQRHRGIKSMFANCSINSFNKKRGSVCRGRQWHVHDPHFANRPEPGEKIKKIEGKPQPTAALKTVYIFKEGFIKRAICLFAMLLISSVPASPQQKGGCDRGEEVAAARGGGGEIHVRWANSCGADTFQLRGPEPARSSARLAPRSGS